MEKEAEETVPASPSSNGAAPSTADDSEVTWVSETINPEEDPDGFFAEIMRKFGDAASLTATHHSQTDEAGSETKKEKKESVKESDEEAKAGGESKDKPLSKRKKKLMSRLSVAELKMLVKRADVVELHDTTAADPRLLVHLKSYRNTVPVPRHWSQKRKYLQGKRGLEKSAFKLPEFIEATGIAKIRDAVKEQEESKKLKAKARERMHPRMGRMDIDYRVLHDAFFKYQTKPTMTIHGDMYYEGKEFEVPSPAHPCPAPVPFHLPSSPPPHATPRLTHPRLGWAGPPPALSPPCRRAQVKAKNYKPGKLSEESKQALGIPPGAPPPWLINMQRYGPPPSYPNLKIPGLNAPIPVHQGAQYGYHPGGWGKPPVNEFGVPLYGDVFGVPQEDEQQPAEKKLWGQLEDEEEEPEEEEEEAPAQEPEGAPDQAALEEESAPTAAELASGTASMAGLETPDVVELRKRKDSGCGALNWLRLAVVGPWAGGRRGTETEEPETSRPLFQVLPEAQASVGQALFGSTTRYVVPPASVPPPTYLCISRLARTPPGSGADVIAQAEALGRQALVQAAQEQAAGGARRAGEKGQVTMSIQPQDLENITEDAIRKRYDDTLRQERTQAVELEDSGLRSGATSGMASGVTTGTESAAGKKHKQPAKDSGKTKKYKDFKF
ncbi:putative Splicing factor 3B subunit 2 [Paratrimastix pyriformis]|uniref:Splicing factor 3B subunit 2 n=1 Tax=Paratrimastix pyriformis TaxID=342808 RepID=A0ABQ8UMZ3_9EUKA|nr:putative Splicing factor 3B subunit 2 [Paratrimastix pyriformis]